MEVVTGKRRHAHNGKDPGGEIGAGRYLLVRDMDVILPGETGLYLLRRRSD